MKSSDGEAQSSPESLPGEAADSERVIRHNTDLVQNDSNLSSSVHESVHAVDVPVRQPPLQEDELLAWLQYPIDDLLDSSYCSDMFGDLPNPNGQLVKHSLDHINFKQQESSIRGAFTALRGTLPSSAGISGLSSRATGSCDGDAFEAQQRVAGADAAMAGGAGRAAGLTSQSGREVFGVVRTTMQPSLAKCAHLASPVSNSEGLDLRLYPLNNDSSQGQNFTIAYTTASLLAPALSGKPDSRNFTHFSRPIEETKATLHMVGAGSGPTNLDRARHQVLKSERVEPNSGDYSLEESVTTIFGMDPYVAQCRTVEACQHNGAADRSLQPPAASEEGNENTTLRDNIINSSTGNDAFASFEKGLEMLEVADPTATSPSRGSESSTEKSGKDVAMTSKRKLNGGEDAGYKSEGAEEFTSNSKKPLSGAKRSRAAQIHNESERRRRDRINEKLKALQDLIPNANKTDKASVLDEAIEYMKLLQSQLQTMSMRTGIGFHPSAIPGMGIQHLQMSTLQHMGWGMGAGMGVGPGMGFGMGTMDANAAAAAGGITMVPMPPLPCSPAVGPPSRAVGRQACNQSSSITEPQENLQCSRILDPHNFYLANHQIRPASSNVNTNTHQNLEMYNVYMQQQQQQQWHQQLLQSHQSRGINGSKPVQ